MMKLYDYLSTDFSSAKRLTVTPREIAELVGLPTAFLQLIEKPQPALIAVKHDADNHTYSETMEFEPTEPGNFWLKVNIQQGGQTTPLMGLKFSAADKNRLDVASPFLRALTPDSDFYIRPILRHEAIENIEDLVCDAAGITAQPRPGRDRSFRPFLAPLFK